MKHRYPKHQCPSRDDHSHKVIREDGHTAWDIQEDGLLGQVIQRNGNIWYKVMCPDCGETGGAIPNYVAEAIGKDLIVWQRDYLRNNQPDTEWLAADGTWQALPDYEPKIRYVADPDTIPPEQKNIKAIETRYAGCRFRSRLEARWAVFFDTLGIGWQYESQGFDINGTYYLPDFLLDCGTWIEVKGDSTFDSSKLMFVAAGLPEMPGKIVGAPNFMLLGPIPRPIPNGDYGWWSAFTYLCEDMEIRTCGFERYHKNKRPWWFSAQLGNYLPTVEPIFSEDEGGYDDSAHISYAAARSARFEHGERG